MKPLVGAAALYLQVYHCPYPFSFAEAGIFKHTRRKRTPKPIKRAKLIKQH